MPVSELKLFVRQIIRECTPGEGYAFSCGNTVANYVKIENYLAIRDIGRKKVWRISS